jgi:hypothetical protein
MGARKMGIPGVLVFENARAEGARYTCFAMRDAMDIQTMTPHCCTGSKNLRTFGAGEIVDWCRNLHTRSEAVTLAVPGENIVPTEGLSTVRADMGPVVGGGKDRQWCGGHQDRQEPMQPEQHQDGLHRHDRPQREPLNRQFGRRLVVRRHQRDLAANGNQDRTVGRV